jgi:hypothetical protein
MFTIQGRINGKEVSTVKNNRWLVSMVPVFLGLFGVAVLFISPALAETKPKMSTGQTVYVPAYSHVFTTDREFSFYLTTTLSVRNVDPSKAIKITSVEYYDNDGKLIKRHLEKPVELAPLASAHYSIKESDKSGGFGANFIVRWQSTKTVNEPVMQCVMVSTRGQQGISFITHGRVIKE